MPLGEWTIIPIMGAILFVMFGVPAIFEWFGSRPRRREAQIQRRVRDARKRVNAIFEAAAERMDRRAGRNDPFRIGRGRGSRW